jgi:glyoxylase I family protein
MFVDHIVFLVSDARRSEKFYSTFLGEPARKHEKSVVYYIKGTKLHFKTASNYASFNKDAGGFNHLAFGLETRAELEKMDWILEKAGIKHSPIDRDKKSGLEYIWFDDPDGMRLEFYLRGMNRQLTSE